MAGGGVELTLAALKAFPRNFRVAVACSRAIGSLLEGGRQRALAARLRWAGAVEALCAALLAFTSSDILQRDACGALSAVFAGGVDPSAGAAARSAGAEARAAAALAAFPDHVGVQVSAVCVLAGLGPPATGAVPFAPATLRSAAAAFAAAAAHSATVPEWREVVPQISVAISNVTLLALRDSEPTPGGRSAAQKELAGCVALAADLLLRHARDPQAAAGLCYIIKNVCDGCPGADVGQANAAVALARSLYAGARSGGGMGPEDMAAQASVEAQAALEAVAVAARPSSSSRAQRRQVAQAAAKGGASSSRPGSAAPPPAGQKCSHCGRVGSGLKNCSLCKVAKYCDVQCQRAAWNAGHKAACPGAAAAAAAKQAAAPAARDGAGKGAGVAEVPAG